MYIKTLSELITSPGMELKMKTALKDGVVGLKIEVET